MYNKISSDLIQKYKSQNRKEFKTILGEVEIQSPYLWKAGAGKGFRPMKEELGIFGNGCSNKLKNPLGGQYNVLRNIMVGKLVHQQ